MGNNINKRGNNNTFNQGGNSIIQSGNNTTFNRGGNSINRRGNNSTSNNNGGNYNYNTNGDGDGNRNSRFGPSNDNLSPVSSAILTISQLGCVMIVLIVMDAALILIRKVLFSISIVGIQF